MNDKDIIKRLRADLKANDSDVSGVCYYCDAMLYDGDDYVSCDSGDMTICNPAADAKFGGPTLKPTKRPCYAYRVENPRNDYTGDPPDPLEKYMTPEAKAWFAKQQHKQKPRQRKASGAVYPSQIDA